MTVSQDKPVASPARRISWLLLIIGLVAGGGAALLLVVLVGMPLALGHRNNLPLEKLYADFAVELAVRTQAGSAQNPYSGDSRAAQAGRLAYTGSCSVCHGVNGDGKGVFGQVLYPPATDLSAHDTQGKTDAQLFWIIKNGLSFAGMPGFSDQYNEQMIWALVSYTRSLTKAGQSSFVVPAPASEQLAKADPQGDQVARGAAVYFAEGCHTCHGAAGNAPGELGLRGGGREASQVVRGGRPGMPVYGQDVLGDAQLADLIAYTNTFARGR
jgi:mono/diheme cytochrome c family protein